MSAGEELATGFLMHRAVLRDLAAQMPDDRVDFSPWSGATGFGSLLLHAAGSHHMFVGIARGDGVVRQDPASLPKDLPSIRSLVGRWTEEDAAAIRELSDAKLAAEVKGLRDQTQPAQAWLQRAREHEIHHKGQLFVYARLCGITPPPWRGGR